MNPIENYYRKLIFYNQQKRGMSEYRRKVAQYLVSSPMNGYTTVIDPEIEELIIRLVSPANKINSRLKQLFGE